MLLISVWIEALDIKVAKKIFLYLGNKNPKAISKG